MQPLACDESGFRHRGPRPVLASGRLIIASGPAACSPLNGVGLEASKPHATASFGLLNQKPRWNVLIGFGFMFAGLMVATRWK